VIVAYALPARNAGLGQSPREVLGVAHDADPQEIKTAFRRLALRYHPDRQGDERRFMEILRAYEILVGKADGKEGVINADWDFHDWYWKFTMHRSKGNNETRASRFKADLPSQLAGLRQRAAVRAAKARAVQTSVEDSFDLDDDFEDCGESPADSGVTSEDSTFDQSARYAEEARRRASLSSSETKESISSQLTGLRRRAKMRVEMWTPAQKKKIVEKTDDHLSCLVTHLFD